MTMRVLIADDHALFRESLRALLEARGYQVVGEAQTGRQALAMARELRPEIVLMDIGMPELSGLEATRQCAVELPDVRVVVLTASDDDANLFEALKAGAQGYLLKSLAADDFFRLLEGVTLGEPALSPSLARKVLQELVQPQRREAKAHDPDALTEREREVLDLMVNGVTSNRKLARELGVSENTVKFHVRNVLDKLRLHNRTEAVSYAIRHRMVDIPKAARDER